MPDYKTSSYNSYQLSGMRYSKTKRILFVAIVLAALGGIIFAYRSYNSDTAKINRFVNSYYAAQSAGNTEKMKTMESKKLKEVPLSVLGASSDKSIKYGKTGNKIVIDATKIGKRSAAITGAIKSTEDKSKSDIPFLVQMTKEDGHWKIALFNIGLLTSEDQK